MPSAPSRSDRRVIGFLGLFIAVVVAFGVKTWLNQRAVEEELQASRQRSLDWAQEATKRLEEAQAMQRRLAGLDDHPAVVPGALWADDSNEPCIPARAVSLGVGGSTSCARMEDGTVRCWGQTGGCTNDGSVEERLSASRLVGVDHVEQIPFADWGACVLKDDGSVVCWGNARILTTDYTPRGLLCTPTKVADMPGAVDVSSNGSSYCARTADGEADCVTTLDALHRYHFSDVAAVAVSNDLRLALRDGRVLSFDEAYKTGYRTLVPISGLRDVVGLAGHINDCAWMRDGSARCSGPNGYGEVGTGRRSEWEKLPGLRVALADITSIALGGGNACALRKDATVWCWGKDPVLDTKPSSSVAPRRVEGLPEIQSIALGNFHACSLGKDGSVWCWGDNAFGQLGDGSKLTRAAPARVELCATPDRGSR